MLFTGKKFQELKAIFRESVTSKQGISSGNGNLFGDKLVSNETKFIISFQKRTMVFFNEFAKPNTLLLQRRGSMSTMCTTCHAKSPTRLENGYDSSLFALPHGLTITQDSYRRTMYDDECKSNNGDPSSPLYTVAKEISWSNMNILAAPWNNDVVNQENTPSRLPDKNLSSTAGTMKPSRSEAVQSSKPSSKRRKSLLPRQMSTKNLEQSKSVPIADRRQQRRPSLGSILLTKAASLRSFWKKTDIPTSITIVAKSKTIPTEVVSLPRSQSYRTKRISQDHLKKQQSERILSSYQLKSMMSIEEKETAFSGVRATKTLEPLNHPRRQSSTRKLDCLDDELWRMNDESVDGDFISCFDTPNGFLKSLTDTPISERKSNLEQILAEFDQIFEV
jgi:hypothetical protein